MHQHFIGGAVSMRTKDLSVAFSRGCQCMLVLGISTRTKDLSVALFRGCQCVLVLGIH